MTYFYKAVLWIAPVCAVAAAAALLFGIEGALGLGVVGFFACLAIGSRGSTPLREYTFTISIFAAVSAAMFYPQSFRQVGTFDLTLLAQPR